MSDFDLDNACAQLKIPKQVYLKILAKALDQTINDLEDLEKGVSSNDCDAVQKLSHRIKGDYANLRVDNISNAAKKINDRIRAEEMISEALKNEYAQLHSLFTEFQALSSSFFSE